MFRTYTVLLNLSIKIIPTLDEAWNDVIILCVLQIYTLAKSTLGLRQISRVGTARRKRDQSVGLRKDH